MITRVTQTMIAQRSLDGLHLSASRVARVQEQLSTGRILNRPSDSPTDTTSAMRVRATMAATKQYARNGLNGQGWLNQIDTTLQSAVHQTTRARELGIQGVNGAASPAAREALATEVEQLRNSLISLGNTRYLERPVFGGITAGSVAYAPDGTFAGTPGDVRRTIGEGVSVRVDMDAEEAFGPHGDNVFAHLSNLANALRSGDTAALQDSVAALGGDLERLTSALAQVGSRSNRVDTAVQRALDDELALTSSLSELENVDLPRAMVDLQLQEVAYQAALAATSRVIQPSLIDFLR